MALLSQSAKILVYTSDSTGADGDLQPWSMFMPRVNQRRDDDMPEAIVSPTADFTKVAWQGGGSGFWSPFSVNEDVPPRHITGGVLTLTNSTSGYRVPGVLSRQAVAIGASSAGVHVSKPNPHPSGWNFSDSGTPSTTSRFHPAGDWSDDHKAFVSVLYHETDACLYLSVDTEVGTIYSHIRLDIGEPFSYSAGAMGFIYRSPDDVVVLYLRADPNDVSATSRPLYAIHFTGSATCTHSRVGDITPDSVVFCRSGGGMFVNTVERITGHPQLADGEYQRMFRLDTNTLALTLLHSSALAENPNTTLILRPTAAQGHHTLTYKGFHYILVSSRPGLSLYRHPVGAPQDITLFVHRWFPQTAGVDVNKHGRNAGIEYDPESDTAYLVFVELERAYEYSNDVGEIRVFVHTAPLDSTAPWSPRMRVANHAEHRIMTQVSYGSSHDMYYWRFMSMIAYLPSRYGVGAMSTLFFYAAWNPTWLNRGFIHTIRFSLWTEPGVIDLALGFDVDTTVNVNVRGEYALQLDVSPEIDTRPQLVRRRDVAWPTRWGSVVDTSVEIAMAWVVQPVVEIDVTEALPIDLDLDWDIEVLVQLEVAADKVVTLDHLWFSVGETFLQDFIDTVNADRSATWGLPPLKLAGSDPYSLEALRTTDIAQRHANNMALTRVHAHDGPEFPPGWQEIGQRLSWLSVDGFGGENIQTKSAAYTYGTPLPTAMEVWTVWRNSPMHYENLSRDWHALAGADNAAHVYSALGCQWGEFPLRDDFSVIPEIPPYLSTVYSTNVFVVIKEQKVDTQFFHQWESAALESRTLDYQWQSASLSRVSRQMVASYDALLQAQHTAAQTSSVAVQHASPTSYAVTMQHAAPYGATIKLHEIDFTARYDMQPRTVSAGHDALWSRSVAQQLAAPYGDTPTLRTQHHTSYAPLTILRRSHAILYWPTTGLAHQHVATHALLHRAGTTHVVGAPLGAFLTHGHTSVWDVRNTNPALGLHTAGYDIDDPAAPMVSRSPVATAYMNGRALDVSDGVVSGSFDAPGFSFEARVDDLSFMRGARLCDPVDIDVDGVRYHMFLYNISGDDGHMSAAAEVRIEARSPVYLLDAPYASNIDYAPDRDMLFSEIVQNGLGVPVDFSRHIDWVIPLGRVAGGAQTPLSFAKALLDETGSRLLSNPDGSLYVLARYPHPFNALPVGIPEHALSVSSDVVTRSSTHEYKRGLNRFRVRDSDAEFGDIVEFDHGTSVASVWVSPYRTNWSLRCTTTPGVLLAPMGEDHFEFEQLLDIAAGSARLTYPILALVSVEWVTDNLGGLSVETGSTAVTAPVAVNHGYGLVRVKYTSRRSRFLLESSAPIEATQLIVVEH